MVKDRDLLWFVEERVAMLFAAVSWVGYPVLRSLAILLFLTTNLMYMFMATLDDVTSETQHSRVSNHHCYFYFYIYRECRDNI